MSCTSMHRSWSGAEVSEYNPAYRTPHFSDASPMHLQSSSAYSDALHIRLCMLCNSALPPASVPPHMLPLLVCLFVCFPFWIVSCQGASETGDMLCPSTHRAPTYLQNGHSRG